jgi:hypothetical protein
LAPWRVGLGALLLTGCKLPTFGEYKGSTTQAQHRVPPLAGLLHRRHRGGRLRPLLILWAIFRYRRKSDEMPVQTQYHTLTEIIYTVVPIIIVLGLFVFTVLAENKVDATWPNPGATIHVYAFQWGWEFDYPNGVKVIGQTTEAPHHGGAGGHDGAHPPQSPRRAARLLRARVQLQPLRQPGY